MRLCFRGQAAFKQEHLGIPKNQKVYSGVEEYIKFSRGTKLIGKIDR
jgi:hypothetical protein